MLGKKIFYSLLLSSSALYTMELNQVTRDIVRLKWNSLTYMQKELNQLDNSLTIAAQHINNSEIQNSIRAIKDAIAVYAKSATPHPARCLSASQSYDIFKKKIHTPALKLLCQIEQNSSSMKSFAQRLSALEWNSYTYSQKELSDIQHSINELLDQTKNQTIRLNLENINNSIKKYYSNINHVSFTYGLSPYNLHHLFEQEIHTPLVEVFCKLMEENEAHVSQ